MQKVCNLGSDSSPIWSLENNKVCGELTSNVNWTFASATAAGSNTSIYNRFFKAVGKEGTFGAETLDIIPGSGEVFMPAMDNVERSGTSGIAWLNTNTGNRVRDNRLLGDFTPTGYDNNNFTKANNWAEIEAMCDVEPIQIGNRLWIDTDKDGVQDPCNEPAIKNMVVSLYNKAGVLIAKDTTDANGEYYFDATNVVDTVGVAKLNNLGPQPNTQYFVVIGKETFGSSAQFDLVTKTINQGSKKYELTTANSTTNSGNDQNDSDFSLGDATIPPALIGYPLICATTPNAGSDHTFDGGFKELCIKPIAGIDQTPSCVGTTPITTTTLAATAISGASWTQVSSNPSGVVITTPSSATSGITGLNPGVYQFIWATSATCADTVKITIPNCAKGSLGDFVWKDTNNNGKQDAGEAGVKNVIIELYKNGSLFSKDTTDASGKYGFVNLDSASYKIRVITSSLAPNCAISLKPNEAGIPDSLDSDVVLAGGFYESQTVIIDPTPTGTALKDNPTLDVGLYSTIKGKLGDYVFLDYNIDGIQNGSDKPVKGIIVELYNELSGTVFARDTTDINGKYLFDNLPMGRYRVRFVPSSIPPQLGFTLPTAGADTTKDSNADTLSGFTKYVNILKATDLRDSVNLTLDAGLKIVNWDPTGYIYCEENGKILKGGIVSVTGPSGAIITILENGSKGHYRFLTDRPGIYVLNYSHPSGYKLSTTRIARPAAAPGFSIGLDGGSLDKDGAVNGLLSIGSLPNADTTYLRNYTASYNPYYLTANILIGEPWITENNLPMSCELLGSLGDFVWKDNNNNGKQDAGEPGVPNVQIELYRNGILLKKDTTDANGKYGFTKLDSASYKIRVITSTFPTDCFISTKPNAAGVPDSLDSDVTLVGGFYESQSVIIDPTPTGTALKDNPTLDVGLYFLSCSITATYIKGICNNNGTIGDVTDDYFTVNVTANIYNGGRFYEVVSGAMAGQGGVVLNVFGTNSGDSITVGKFKADGTTTQILTIRDSQNSNCYKELNVSSVNSCSVLPCSPVPICLPLKSVRN